MSVVDRLAEVKQLNLLSQNLNKVTRGSRSDVSFLQSSSLVSSEEDKTFSNDDVLLPLRKAAEGFTLVLSVVSPSLVLSVLSAAKKFAADVKLQAMKLKARHSSAGSLVQSGKSEMKTTLETSETKLHSKRVN